MNLDELRTVQSKERSKDSLQHLRESFYADVADYIEELKDRRDRAAERSDDPFDDPEVNRLTDEIHTAEDVVEAVYERRVGKVVKRASLAAAGMPADDEGLTNEERELFAELVERIEENKAEVLDILAGETTADSATTDSTTADAATPDAAPAGSGAADPTPDPGDAPAPSEDVSPADVMGGGDPAASSAAGADASASNAESEPARPDADEATAVAGGPDDADAESDEDDTDDPTEGLEERTTIRITRDVGEIFGVDERTYELASEDVVTLPEENAGPLVERGAAEKLE